MERSLKEQNGELPAGDRERVERLIAEVRKAVKEEAPVDRVKSLKADLESTARAVTEAAYKKKAEAQAQTAGAGCQAGPGSCPGTGPDDVVDAEFSAR